MSEVYALCTWEPDGSMKVLQVYESLEDVPGKDWHHAEPAPGDTEDE